MTKRAPFLLLIIFTIFIAACSKPPPDELFTEEIRKMAALDRGLGFKEEISSIEVIERIEHPEQYEIQVRVEGWATHPELSIGATLPATSTRRDSWARWTFFCKQREDKSWIIQDKFKVEEGFY